MDMRALARITLLAATTLLLGACGGGGSNDSGDPKSNTAGKKVFADAGCGGCHTLAAAGSTGSVGPNLDQVKPSRDEVVQQVKEGGGAMPAFEDKLSEQEIEDVADFVVGATGSASSGGSVAAAFKPDDTKVEDCDTEWRCFEQAFANLAYEEGPGPALDRFDREIKTPGPIEADCHRIVHAIGAGALKHFDNDVGKAFAAGRASCTSGYYHGILERAFLGLEEDELAPTSRKLCSDAEIRKTEFIAYQCVHGLGHGLMIYTGYDLPLSIETCHQLNGEWDQKSCTGGVFMENIQSSYGVRSRWLRNKDLIYPCNFVADRDRYYCYDLLPGRVLQAVGWNFGKAAGWCRKVEQKWKWACFQGLGREASGFTRLDPARIIGICRRAGNMAHECLIGASKDMTYTDVSPRRAKVLCDTAPIQHRAYCWRGIGNLLGSLHREMSARKQQCDSATTRFRIACYQGAGVDG